MSILEHLMSQRSSESRELLEGLINIKTLGAVYLYGPVVPSASVGKGITLAPYGNRQPVKKLLRLLTGCVISYRGAALST